MTEQQLQSKRIKELEAEGFYVIKLIKTIINFYNKKLKYVKSTLLKKDNIALLMEGAHGFKVKKNCIFLEIKQGPFSIKKDKKLI